MKAIIWALKIIAYILGTIIAHAIAALPILLLLYLLIYLFT